MVSKIINMVDKIKDAGDRWLETVLRAEQIADDGFSDRILGKIRRRLWLRRISLPLAATLGGSVAIKPLTALVAWLSGLLSAIPGAGSITAASWVPAPNLIALGGLLFVTLLVGLQMLED